jgi:hypothetical protein
MSFGYFKAGFFTPIGPPSRGVTALTDAATVTTDAAIGPLFTLTLRGNRMLANPANLRAGKTYTWILTQDSMGSRTLAYGS